jgi:hypothetical protein
MQFVAYFRVELLFCRHWWSGRLVVVEG